MKRGYDYHPGSNRLRATSVLPDLIDEPENYTDDSYEHDAHGNMIAMSAILGGLTWDEDDRLQTTDDITAQVCCAAPSASTSSPRGGPNPERLGDSRVFIPWAIL